MKTKHVFFVFISVSFLLFLSSCSFFTTSWGSSFARDLGERFSKMSSTELAQLMEENPSLREDRASSNAWLEALGKKGQSEISGLSLAHKKDIMDVMVNNSITFSVIESIAADVKNLDTEEGVKEFIKNVLENISTVDTNAIIFVLKDKENLQQNDSDSVLLSSTCLVGQVAKTECLDEKFDTIIDEIKNIVNQTDETNLEENIHQAGEAIIGNNPNSSKSLDGLETALYAIYAIKDSEKTVAGFKICDLFDKLTDASSSGTN